MWHAAKAAKPGAPALQKSAEDAAAKAVPGITEALKGKPGDWIPKWVEFWRLHGKTGTAKPLVENYLAQREKQRGAAARLFNESQVLFRSEKRDEAFKVLEKLRDECPYTYQGYFACRWLSEKK